MSALEMSGWRGLPQNWRGANALGAWPHVNSDSAIGQRVRLHSHQPSGKPVPSSKTTVIVLCNCKQFTKSKKHQKSENNSKVSEIRRDSIDGWHRSVLREKTAGVEEKNDRDEELVECTARMESVEWENDNREEKLGSKFVVVLTYIHFSLTLWNQREIFPSLCDTNVKSSPLS